MLALLPFALLLEVFVGVDATPVEAPAHPMITQRAVLFGREPPLDFVGYYYTTDGSGNTVITSSVNSGSVSNLRFNTLVDWCPVSYPSTACLTAYGTSCFSNTLYTVGGSTSCSSTCDYDVIYMGNTATSDYRMWYHCMDRAYLFFYREQPAGRLIEDPYTTSSSSSETSESSSDSSSTEPNSETARPAALGTTTAPSQTSDPTPTPTPEPEPEKKESKAWIAGVVIGIAGLLAVAGMGFYLWRRRQQKQPYQPAAQDPQMQPGYPPHQSGYPLQQQQPYGTSPGLQPTSPNMSAYDAQTYYGQTPKPEKGTMYPQYGGPSPGVGTVQMPQSQPELQPRMTAASIQELPELVTSSGR